MTSGENKEIEFGAQLPISLAQGMSSAAPPTPKQPKDEHQASVQTPRANSNPSAAKGLPRILNLTPISEAEAESESKFFPPALPANSSMGSPQIHSPPPLRKQTNPAVGTDVMKSPESSASVACESPIPAVKLSHPLI